MQRTRTKIVVTLGPASERPDTLRRLIEAGVDVFRLNFSHGDHDSHANYIRLIRQAAAASPWPVAVMQDLQGPRIRTGALRSHQPVLLEQGADVVLRPGDFEGDAHELAVTYERLPADVRPGSRILLKDGLIELEVLSTDGHQARCRVAVGGWLLEHQGMNLPGVELSIPSPTPKDIEDLRFGLEQQVDYVAMSFVRAGDDVRRLKDEMARRGARVPVIAKIERPEAVENVADILSVSDGLMVARGDLGIEMPAEAVPAAQKKLIRAANCAGLPVITATQMLESMVDSPRPTRAEASDVANAILDGTDAVMLSAETSIGKYPVEAVRVMDSIARNIEDLMRQEGRPARQDVASAPDLQEHALASAACAVADQLQAAAIVPFTMTGSTARYVSQRRPGPPIYALTPDARTYRRLALVWGVWPVMLDMFESTDEMIERGTRRLRELGLASQGDTVVCVAGASTRTPGGTDMLKIHRF
jgi:pyruvate kinase